jgi:uncharacterized protein YbbC (DUF1343 family)
VLALLAFVVVMACAKRPAETEARSAGAGGPQRPPSRVVPGISVLLSDSIHLIAGKRVALITNQTGIDERGTSDIDLLWSDPRATKAAVKLVALFSPEHGIRGTEDRTNVESGIDAKTGLPIHSLYTTATIGPPDSTLAGVEALVVDLQDIGTRTWTYVGVMLYSLRNTGRLKIPVIVLDRPNPITGSAVQGPMLDSGLANVDEPRPDRPGRAYALYAMPLRHGMTMGELARFYDAELHLGADLHVVPARGWRRSQWFDETSLPWVRPSPNLPNLTSALLYPALVPFEGAPNVSVGRGTPDAFQRFGAPWLDAPRVAAMLNERDLGGVRFEAERFTPRGPGDGKFDGRELPGIRIIVTDRERLQAGRIGAAILWALARAHKDSLRLNAMAFDLRFGRAALREALLRGDDPDGVLDKELPAVVAFQQRAKQYYLYR